MRFLLQSCFLNAPAGNPGSRCHLFRTVLQISAPVCFFRHMAPHERMGVRREGKGIEETANILERRTSCSTPPAAVQQNFFLSVKDRTSPKYWQLRPPTYPWARTAKEDGSGISAFPSTCHFADGEHVGGVNSIRGSARRLGRPVAQRRNAMYPEFLWGCD